MCYVSGVPARGTHDPIVYFLRFGDGPVKIGTTRNMGRRLGWIWRERNLADPLTMLVCRWGGRPVERAEHERFASAREEGEWFRPTPEVLARAAELEGLGLPFAVRCSLEG